MSEEETSKKNKDTIKNGKIGNKQLVILLSAVFVVWLTTAFITPFIYKELSDRGIFGDSFGMINSLFSGFAFSGIIFTILLQRKELKLQRDELELTREQLEKSANAQIASQEELAKQSLNMKRTAELNALSTLIQNLQIEIDHHEQEMVYPNNHLQGLLHEKTQYLNRIKDILEMKED